MHQTGSGVVLPVWAACFGGQWRNESGESWKYCGDSVLKAGLGQLYPFGHANFTDRHKGAHFFGQSIPGIISLHCTKHIIENARHYVCQAQKSFHDNMVWALQGSRSQGEYYVHLAKFNTNYPDVKVKRACYYLMQHIFLSIGHLRKAYLELIPKEDWVHYAQVARGAYLRLEDIESSRNRHGMGEKNEVII